VLQTPTACSARRQQTPQRERASAHRVDRCAALERNRRSRWTARPATAWLSVFVQGGSGPPACRIGSHGRRASAGELAADHQSSKRPRRSLPQCRIKKPGGLWSWRVPAARRALDSVSPQDARQKGPRLRDHRGSRRSDPEAEPADRGKNRIEGRLPRAAHRPTGPHSARRRKCAHRGHCHPPP
jgi:hypothetical protein